MANNENLFVTFYTTAEAMATEEACKSRNIEGKLVPVPRVLSAGCGISWKGNSKDKDITCLLYTSPSPRDGLLSRMPSSA